MVKRVKITGQQGRWLAEAEGRWLPCIHTRWLKTPSMTYHDPHAGDHVGSKRYEEWIEAMRSQSLVILQKDKPDSFARAGYIGIFEFENLKLGDDGSVSLRLTARYADPKS
jgi:hypothetical protein